MQDGIIKGDGNSRLLKAPETIPTTYAEFRNALISGTLSVDLLFNAIGWDATGTPLNKATLLSDAVAAALGLESDDPTVSEAINALLAVATAAKNGLMSATDKTKLDGVATGANNYVHPTTAGNKHIPSGGSVDSILGYSASGTAIWIQQLAEKSLLSVATQALYGGLTTVDAALKNYVKKDNVVVISTSGTWTPPRANMLIDIFMIGGGGGGASYTSSYAGGGGGGGYPLFIKDFKITSVTPISALIGAGGANASGGSAGLKGGDGGTTKFGGFIAKGGKGANSTTGGDGGAGGGSGSASSSTAGGVGADGYGGDGASDGTRIAGIGGVFTNSPFGGYCPINNTLYGGAGGGYMAAGGSGGGGAGATGASVAATAGTLYGAGGGGSYMAASGAGKVGVIIIGYNN